MESSSHVTISTKKAEEFLSIWFRDIEGMIVADTDEHSIRMRHETLMSIAGSTPQAILDSFTVEHITEYMEKRRNALYVAHVTINL